MEAERRTFTIDRCLGRGGFGEVYRAEMRTSAGISSLVALKVLRRDLAPGGQAVQRLRDEGRMLARLDHPTILKVHDLLVLDGRVSLVTEYVDGDDLERCLRPPDPMPLRALLEVLAQVASALDAAYNAPVGEAGALRLVHRDVKPSNVRIGRHGEVKLLDFGIARSDEMTREARTLTDTMIGSPPYMAPERFLDAQVRSASDVFALGAMLVEGITGVRTFDLPVTILASHAIDRARYDKLVEARIGEIGDRAPPEVVALARELLAYDPDARPTAGGVARRCEALADAVGGPTLARWCRDRRWAEPPREAGELAGRVITEEGTLDRPHAPAPPAVVAPPAAAARPTSRRLGLAIGGASVLSVGVLLVGLGAIGVAVGVALFAWPEPAAVEPPPPAPASAAPAPVAPAPVAPAPAPVADPVVAPAPAVAPAPVPAAPPPRPRPAPEPVAGPPVAPAPQPAARPAPPPPATAAARARVGFTGDAPAELVRDGVHVKLPAEVEPGTWEVWASFKGQPAAPTGKRLTVTAGGAHTVECRDRMLQCSVR